MKDSDEATLAAMYDGLAPVYVAQVSTHLAYRDRVDRFLATTTGALLDVGCGPGQLTAHLDADVAVTGLDLSPKMIAEAKALRPSGRYVVHDFHAPLPEGLGPFDRVLAVGAFEFCRDLPAVIAGLAERMRPGAQLFFSVCERRPNTPQADSVRPQEARGHRFNSYYYSLVEVGEALAGAGLFAMSYEHGLGWSSPRGDFSMAYGYWRAQRPESAAAK